MFSELYEEPVTIDKAGSMWINMNTSYESSF